VNSNCARHQQELESKLQAAEQRQALLEANCLGLNEQLEQGRQSLQQLRREADERVAELEQRHDQRLQEARQEAERRETLAYERLEGLRVRLYEQVEEERQAMKLAQRRCRMSCMRCVSRLADRTAVA
jgi:chromosome segregation ATPase